MTRPVTLSTDVYPCSVPGTPNNDAEIIEAIRKLKNYKATGQDGIAPRFLRLIAIINLIWKTGRVPQAWKRFASDSII